MDESSGNPEGALVGAQGTKAPASQTQAVASTGFALPTGYQEILHFCQMMAKSSIVPETFKNDPMAVWVCIDRGIRQGYSILQSLQNIAVIKGKPQIYGDEPLACVRRSGALEYIREHIEGSGDDMVAKCIVKRRGDPDEIEREWTVEDAKKAQKWKSAGPWTTYPKRMLQMKARNFALRDVFGDVLGGAQILGEGEDVPETATLLQQSMGETQRVDVLPTSQATSLDAVLRGISEAKSLASLDEVGATARQLPEPEAARARPLFLARRKELIVDAPAPRTKAQRILEKKRPSIKDAPPQVGDDLGREGVVSSQEAEDSAKQFEDMLQEARARDGANDDLFEGG